MELAQLRTLRELRDRGSIAAVAAAFQVSPSAVSQQLAALQRSAGIALTRLDGRRTVLTDAGIALAQAAVGVESAMTDARESIERFHQEHTATVSVSALASMGVAFFPALLSRRLPGNPTLMLSDHDVTESEYVRLTSDIDLVIAHRLPGSGPWPREVASIPLLDEPLDLAARDGHPLSGAAPVTAAELADAEWINVYDGFPLVDAMARIGALSGREPVTRHRINDFAVRAAVLAAGDCVALLPRYTGSLYLSAGVSLRPLAPDLAVNRRIDILARPDTLRRSAVRVVLDALLTHANDLVRDARPADTNTDQP